MFTGSFILTPPTCVGSARRLFYKYITPVRDSGFFSLGSPSMVPVQVWSCDNQLTMRFSK